LPNILKFGLHGHTITIVFSFYTTWCATEDNMQYVLEIYVGQSEAKNYTRQIIIKVYSSIFQKCGLAAHLAVSVSQWILYQIMQN